MDNGLAKTAPSQSRLGKAPLPRAATFGGSSFTLRLVAAKRDAVNPVGDCRVDRRIARVQREAIRADESGQAVIGRDPYRPSAPVLYNLPVTRNCVQSEATSIDDQGANLIGFAAVALRARR